MRSSPRPAGRKTISARSWSQHGFDVADPPGTYNGDDEYYAVFFNDPDGMRLEAMVYGPEKRAKKRAKKKRRS